MAEYLVIVVLLLLISFCSGWLFQNHLRGVVPPGGKRWADYSSCLPGVSRDLVRFQAVLIGVPLTVAGASSPELLSKMSKTDEDYAIVDALALFKESLEIRTLNRLEYNETGFTDKLCRRLFRGGEIREKRLEERLDKLLLRSDPLVDALVNAIRRSKPLSKRQIACIDHKLTNLFFKFLAHYLPFRFF
jgi:hypothetical protein